MQVLFQYYLKMMLSLNNNIRYNYQDRGHDLTLRLSSNKIFFNHQNEETYGLQVKGALFNENINHP